MKTITQKKERTIKKEIQEMIKKLASLLKYLKKYLISRFDFSNFFLDLNQLNQDLIHTSSIVSQIFTTLPLGKDLRRNISYLNILRSLREISDNCFNVANYFVKNSDFAIEKDWVVKIIEKLVRRLDSSKLILTSESIESANALIEKDKSINEIYKNVLEKFYNDSKKISEKKISPKDRSIILNGFVIAMKNFELMGDSIKKIAESILYISTGKFK